MILIRTFTVENQEGNDSENGQSSESTESRTTEDTRLKHIIKQYLIRSTPEVLHLLTHISWQSYGYFFFKYIVGISSSSFGILYFISQLTKALIVVLLKYFRRSLFTLSRRLSQHGEDKTLHVFGSVGVLVFWPFILAPCIGCITTSPEGLLVAAYTFPVLLYSASWALIETTRWKASTFKSSWSHANHQHYILRSCSRKAWLALLLHLVTWVLLAHDNAREITSATQTPFSSQTIFILVIGFFATFLYHIAMDDTPRKRRNKKSEKDKRETRKDECTSTASSPPPPPPTAAGTKPWRQRLQNLEYLQSMFTYILSANSFNVVLLVLPVYLMESLQFDKFSAAYVPAVVYGGWGLSTLAARKLIDVAGYKLLFGASSFTTFLASVWFFAQSASSNYVMYIPALMFGFSSCVAVMTSHMMVIIQSRATVECPVGVDDFTSTIEFLTNGIVVLIIMQLYPGNQQDSRSVDQFLRLVMFLVPALHVTVALVEAVYYIRLPLATNQATESQGEEMKIRAIRLNISSLQEPVKEDVVISDADLKILKDLPSTDV